METLVNLSSSLIKVQKTIHIFVFQVTIIILHVFLSQVTQTRRRGYYCWFMCTISQQTSITFETLKSNEIHIFRQNVINLI